MPCGNVSIRAGRSIMSTTTKRCSWPAFGSWVVVATLQAACGAGATREAPPSDAAAPVDLAPDAASTMDIAPDVAPPVDIEPDVPPPVDVVPDVPPPVDIAPDVPPPVDVAPDVPAPVDVAPDVPSPVDVAPDVPAPVDIVPDVPAPVDVAPDVPPPVDVAPDVPAPVDIVPDLPPPVDAAPDVIVVKYHPATWMILGNAGFHGTAAKTGLTACTGCHGAQLDGGSVAKVSCNLCHDGWQTDCTFCHGGLDNKTGAPPISVTGGSATTLRGVGAHSTHVSVGPLANAFDCTECHTKPASALDADHVKPSPATVLAAAGWDGAAGNCTNACHGAFVGGNANNRPHWTQVDGTQAVCGTCHVLPPKTGHHPANFGKHSSFGCSTCHSGMVNDAATAILTIDLHVNGVKDVKFKAGGTWNATNKTCAPACHGTKSW